MDHGSYRYIEVHAPTPEEFGSELTRMLGEFRAKGATIESVSMSIGKVDPSAMTGERPSRIAQVLIWEPSRGITVSRLNELAARLETISDADTFDQARSELED